MDVYKMKAVRVGENLRVQAEQFVAGQHHKVVVTQLCQYRERLEAGMEPESWTTLETLAVTFLADVCDALCLTESEKARVLGQSGETTLTGMLESRPMLKLPLNERQSKVLQYVATHGAIRQRDYRQLYPDLSDEARRLDLVDLAMRGFLKRCGCRRGTYYIATL